MAGAMVIRSSTASAGLISAHGVRRRAHRDGSAAPPLDRRVAVEGAEEAPAVVTGWSEAAVFVADLGLLGVLVIADLLSGATRGASKPVRTRGPCSRPGSGAGAPRWPRCPGPPGGSG